MEKIIPMAEPLLSGNELRYVKDCIEKREVSFRGKYVEEFEKKFSKYCGCRSGIATSSGTTALHLALASLGIKKGDEVIIPSFTMISTANAVVYTGAKPVLVDSERKTWNMDPDKIEEKITKKTKAVMPVHVYGHPAEMDRILDIAKDHDLYVIEDAAEAHGAEYKGSKTGGLGDVGCFSFYGNKIITTGEGGMVVTKNEKVAETAKLLRDMDLDNMRSYRHTKIGFSYRMSNLQAAIGLAQLEMIDSLVKIRLRNAKKYNSLLSGVRGIKLPPKLNHVRNVYWMYSILIEKDFKFNRDELMKKLEGKGITTRRFFFPMHRQPVFSGMFPGSYRVSEELSKKGMNLPSAATLEAKDIKYVVDSIISC